MIKVFDFRFCFDLFFGYWYFWVPSKEIERKCVCSNRHNYLTKQTKQKDTRHVIHSLGGWVSSLYPSTFYSLYLYHIFDVSPVKKKKDDEQVRISAITGKKTSNLQLPPPPTNNCDCVLL